MATDIAIANLPNLPAGQVAGGDILPIVDISDLTDPGGTTKGTTVTAIAQYTNTYNGVFNVKNFGAVGNGIADDTVAIQAAINAAEVYIPSPDTLTPQSPLVYIPSGQYKISASLLVTLPICLRGDGPQQTLILANGVNVPAIKIAPTLSQSTYVTYDVESLAILGLNTAYATRDLADGISVASASNDITSRLRNLRVIGMTGNGIAIRGQGNSTIIKDVISEDNSESGLLITTVQTPGFNTNFIVDSCFFRLNRRGAYLQGFSPAGFINSGRIRNCLFESNNGGQSGSAVQTTDRPSVGLQMEYCTGVQVDSCYFENHCNALYMAQPCFYNRISNNYWLFGGDWELPHTYGGPVQYQLGIFINNGFGNVFSKNVYVAYPHRPVDCSTTDWNTGTFGDSYEYVTDLLGGEIFEDELGLQGSTSQNPPFFWVTNPNNYHVIRYIGARTGRDINYNIKSDLFNVQLGKMGLGGNTASNTMLNIVGSVLQGGGATQAGAIINPTVGSDATGQADGIQVLVQTTAAAYTVTALIGMRILNAVLGAGSSVTTQYGLFIDNLSGATTNYAIKTGTGQVQFGDKFACNGATPQAAAASGGAAPAGGTGATAGAYDTASHRDALITLVNNMRTALVNNGIMS